MTTQFLYIPLQEGDAIIRNVASIIYVRRQGNAIFVKISGDEKEKPIYVGENAEAYLTWFCGRINTMKWPGHERGEIGDTGKGMGTVGEKE